jgi:hypothetical protein
LPGILDLLHFASSVDAEAIPYLYHLSRGADILPRKFPCTHCRQATVRSSRPSNIFRLTASLATTCEAITM